jgi:hypothetical protein
MVPGSKYSSKEGTTAFRFSRSDYGRVHPTASIQDKNFEGLATVEDPNLTRVRFELTPFRTGYMVLIPAP